MAIKYILFTITIIVFSHIIYLFLKGDYTLQIEGLTPDVSLCVLCITIILIIGIYYTLPEMAKEVI